MKNNILIASALDDWKDADIFRLAAEQQWRTSYCVANRQGDTDTLEALKSFRKELDELEEFRMEDLGIIVPNDADYETYYDGSIDDAGYEYQSDEMDEDMLEEEDTGTGTTDSASVAKTENQVQVVEPTDLPIRPVSEHTNRIPITPAAAGPFLSHKQIRRQKSFLSKGGAFHAQQFSKSLNDREPSVALDVAGKDAMPDQSVDGD
ncbi:hypothetical protein ACET3X_004240 [Alternaria dauci]|uniref:Uncharacterized protein n=1 Tax=Alternaria dauci TaxID=48095 RepID=A0ABR3UMS6_9PLEO